MPFPFRYICDLLQQLDDQYRKVEHKRTPAKTVIETWFRQHRSTLDAPGNDVSAILSTLLPEKRTDRVYLIQAPRLESIFGKAQLLGASRVQELRRYRTAGLGVDLADCVEAILTDTPNPTGANDEVTVEEIDDALGSIAAACRFSSPSVRASYKTQDTKDQDRSFTGFYRRLSPRDAKWFTRLVLKNYQPVIINEWHVFRFYHPLLPQAMKAMDDLTVATAFLHKVRQSPHDQSAIANILKPSIGTKVGRQMWFKGRSIKHCLDMGRSREMSCEQKLDGEYCQIHIDLRKPRSPIQIFSKSGKDSTEDRAGLHGPIRESLMLGTPDCPLRTGCILEGELVVYSTKENKILPFHKIRKHVSRSGSFIGTFYDSQPHDYEHLMIVYYDVLMIDDESMLGVRHSERFKRLSELVACREGHAELVSRETISFGRPSAASRLREFFAKCIVSRGEGIVLKPDEPYFDFNAGQKPYSCCNIKLKKEYIQGWGDVGDFAVVGASYDAAKAKEYKTPNLKWTHFFIGCLENKEEAQAKIEKPRFVVTNVIELTNEALLSTVMTQCFPSPVPFGEHESITIHFLQGGTDKRPTDVFLDPLVFDMRCFSFVQAPNTTFWSMRFPMVSKIHHDRSYLDTISFVELQAIALNATETPEVEDSQEMRKWISALEKADPQGRAVDYSTSQESIVTATKEHRVSSRRNHRPKEARNISSSESIDETRSQGGSSLSRHDKAIIPRGPLTPPLSSPVEDCENSTPPDTPRNSPRKSPTKLGTQKRPAPETVVVTKRQRISYNASISSQSTSGSIDLPPNTSSGRQPLSQIDTNSCTGPGTKSQPIMVEDSQSDSTLSTVSPLIDNDCSPSPGLVNGTESSIISPPLARPVSTGEEPAATQHLTLKPCSFVGRKCALISCSILLSPCISQYVWVTDNLLRGHGIHNFITDPKSWSEAPIPETSTRERDASPQKTKRVRLRKICLVESRRRDATMSFIAKIEEAGLKTKNGDREWVGVYDWRILEDISNIESRIAKQLEGMDPWRKHYVGIA
ncbi:hypothetical protein GGS26DRAFT_536276 [Hypomontagnella submonticulosa]|nr:hypothetical protein GGS26DRAFT_536276 [Hypomontagnella submonticulosa]